MTIHTCIHTSYIRNPGVRAAGVKKCMRLVVVGMSIYNTRRSRRKFLILTMFQKNLNASKPSEHPPHVEECLKV